MWLVELGRRFAVSLTLLLSAGPFHDRVVESDRVQVQLQSPNGSQLPYLLGVGIGDVTGPVVETNMMGYARLNQVDTGLHMRQRSRAFIVADASNSSSRFLFINSDICMGDTGVRRSLLSTLASDPSFSGFYTPSNVAFVGTHQHAGVGGYLENLLPQITSLGYINASASALLSGTLHAVRAAHASLQPGSLRVGKTRIEEGNVNRSPAAYLRNPEEERKRYEGDQDKEMTVVRFDDERGHPRGFLAFYAVHGTSLYNNNTLVSGDNKGMAAFLYERMMEPNAMPGNTSFVAGFVQSNVGDTSPNTLGAYCESHGKPWDRQPCDFEHSTCGNKTKDCHGRGPGFRISDFESNRIIGDLQFQGAKTVMESADLLDVRGPVRSVHVYMNMSFHSFKLPNGTEVQTCPPALGYGFAGGTTDGPGTFDFVQGDNNSEPHNPFWELVKGFVTPLPSKEQATCQAPKHILLNTGYAHAPYEWSPSTVDIQMLRVGQVVILAMPGELTTMAGRRIREAIQSKIILEGILSTSNSTSHDSGAGERAGQELDPIVLIAGPVNTYGHYVATPEEYGLQRYEGASTLYGPHTLDAYISKYTQLVPYLAEKVPEGQPESDPEPEDQTSKAISLQLPVLGDNPPLFYNFGDVLSDTGPGPYSVNDTVRVWFAGANPRNNLRLEGTFLSIEMANHRVEGGWKVVRSDSHPSTVYEWVRNSTILGTSTVTISWTIENGTPPGMYRIRYFGDAKAFVGGKITPFWGLSSSFAVV